MIRARRARSGSERITKGDRHATRGQAHRFQPPCTAVLFALEDVALSQRQPLMLLNALFRVCPLHTYAFPLLARCHDRSLMVFQHSPRKSLRI
jgi:hypothetical protein